MTTRKMLVVVITMVILTWPGQSFCVAASPIPVPRWQPYDFTFHIDNTPEGPFQIPFSAEVTGPRGVKQADEWVSVGYCLANHRKEYVVFQNKAQGFSLKLESLFGPAKAKGFNPFTGEYQDAGTLTAGTVQLTPPQTWDTDPMALHVRAGPAASSNEGLRRSELSLSWKIKSIPPQGSLTAATLTEAERASDTDGWLTAGVMPATVHDILLRHGKIEAPWLPGGTEKCFWVGEKDWVYAVRFETEDQGHETWLRFKGIENRVDVYLNGEPLSSHSGKLPLSVNVSGRLRPENSLALHFHSDSRPGKTDSPERGHRSNSGAYLGPNPTLSSVGVFDKVLVEISDGHLMKEIVTDVSLNEALTKGTVTVDAVGTSHLSSVEVRVRLVACPDVGDCGDPSICGS